MVYLINSNIQEICNSLFNKRLLILACFVFSFISCADTKVYRDAELGIALEIPENWNLEKSDRITLIELYPEGVDKDADNVSITILGVANEGNDVPTIMESELERLQQSRNITDITITQEQEEFPNDKFEAAIVRFIVPIESEPGSNNSNNKQLAELIVIKGSDLLIVCHIFKSDTNEVLNAQADEIINSIYFINGN